MAQMGMDEESWERVSVYNVPVGTILIQEKMHWEYTTGMPADSTYIRVRVGEHKTVSGMMRHVEAEPSFAWPTSGTAGTTLAPGAYQSCTTLRRKARPSERFRH